MIYVTILQEIVSNHDEGKKLYKHTLIELSNMNISYSSKLTYDNNVN